MGRKLTKEEFIKRATEIHGDKYDYTEVNYINNSTKVKIYDNELDEFFWITPASILCGCGNKKAISSKLRKRFSMGKSAFIEKAIKIHGNKYNYLKVEYINNRTKVCIVCAEHGEFWQAPEKHLSGQGCPKCCKRNFKFTKEDFIKRAKEAHGNKYNYSKVEYGKNDKTKVCIICPEHGEFWQAPNIHIRGCGCKYCSKGEVFNTEDFIKKSKIVHDDFYDYSKSIFKTSFDKLEIICPIHGVFKQKPLKHLQGHGCHECAKLRRKKETKLFNVLKNNFPKVEIIHSYHNANILSKQELDIYIPQYKIAIEFQGEQHFKPIDFGNYGNERAISLFNDNIQRDIKKKQICEENKIKLLYFSNVNENTFLGEKLFREYDDLVKEIKYIIKKEDNKINLWKNI